MAARSFLIRRLNIRCSHRHNRISKIDRGGSVHRKSPQATAVIASLLLAGVVSCGGGGSSGASTTPPPGGSTGTTGSSNTPATNSAPVITSADSITVHSGTTTSFYTVTATDADNDTLTYSISGRRFPMSSAPSSTRRSRASPAGRPSAIRMVSLIN